MSLPVYSLPDLEALAKLNEIPRDTGEKLHCLKEQRIIYFPATFTTQLAIETMTNACCGD